MRLNDLKPGAGSKHAAKRLGRGVGSGLGKTGGRGHKGQKSRSGGFHKVGFEGGQMPLQRRLPKFGFHSRKQAYVAQVRLDALQGLEATEIDLLTLKKAGLVKSHIRHAKVIRSGELSRAVTIKGLGVTKGAVEAIEAAGGKVEQ